MTVETPERLSPLRDASDAELVARCLRGDESSWAAVIDKYKNLIYSIPIKYGLDQDDAAEVFQSTCVELLIRLPELREPRALAAWLIRVAASKARTKYRERARVSPIDEAENDPIPGEPRQEEILEQAEKEQILRQVVNALPARCHKLIRMLFYETPALPYAEVASRLGLAVGSIGFIRGRCLSKLRARLEEAGMR